MAGIKISQVWKLPFYGYALFVILKDWNFFSRNLKLVLLLGFLTGTKLLLNVNFYQGFMISLAEFFYTISLPLIILYFYRTYFSAPEKLRLLITYFSIFLIVSNIPFVTGILTQRNNVVELDRFGLENSSALNGLFHHVSSTSKILVVSVLFLLANLAYTKKRFYYLLYVGVLVFGAYAIYLSYTRTGWLLLFLGVLMMVFYKTSIKRFFRYIPTVVFGLLVVAFLFRNNETILLRLKGGTTYRQNEEIDANVLTSYRLDIYVNALINLNNDGKAAIVLGQGRQRAQQLMGQIYGTDFVAHNRLIELLQYGGELSLLLFLLYVWRLWLIVKELSSRVHDFMSKLPFALFGLYVLSLLPSHGFPLWSDLIFGGVIAYNLIKNHTSEQSELITEQVN